MYAKTTTISVIHSPVMPAFVIVDEHLCVMEAHVTNTACAFVCMHAYMHAFVSMHAHTVMQY